MFILWPFTEDVCLPCSSSFFLSRIDRESVNLWSICQKTLREIKDLLTIYLTTGCHKQHQENICQGKEGRHWGQETMWATEEHRGKGNSLKHSFLFIWLVGWSFGCTTQHVGSQGILVPRPGFQPTPPELAARSLNHWTTWEVPRLHFLNLQCSAELPGWKEHYPK